MKVKRTAINVTVDKKIALVVNDDNGLNRVTPDPDDSFEIITL